MERLFSLIMVLFMCSIASAQESEVHIDLSKKGADVPSSMYGVFFEEITGSGDGGLYAEMIRNRGFEDGVIPSGCTLDDEGFAAAEHKYCYSNDSINKFRVRWSPVLCMTGWNVEYDDGSAASYYITDEYPLNSATPHSLAVDLNTAFRDINIVNHGYWGMSVEAGKTYNLEFYVRSEGTPWCRPSIVSSDGRKSYSEVELIRDGEWHCYKVSFCPDFSDGNCCLSLRFPSRGRVWVDFVSLFPEDTFMGRKNGLRKDVAGLIADMHPAFVRWPGGCIVEGLTLENRVKWKETIGEPVTRRGEYNLWGYRSTYGFGYHEFLQFCEDIGADGMFVCNAGMSCLFRNGDYVQGDELEPLIQDALDAIEYAIGGTDTEWGAKRAANGHPAPFPLKYVEIGNENVFSRYAENYNRFHKAIKEKYPQITLITALMFSKDVHRLEEVEMIDPHYYETAEWFYRNADVYDKLSRKVPYDVYVGEYAAVGRSDMFSSLAEAAFLAGAEKNSDKVKLLSYAPLISNSHFNSNHLIVVNGEKSYGRSNYHVVKTFSENRPDYNVKASIKNEVLREPVCPKGFIGLSTGNTVAAFKDFKVESKGRTIYSTDWSDMDSWKTVRGNWKSENGILNQESVRGDALIYLKDMEFGDCTISMKAKRIRGNEGFRIVFGLEDEGHYFMADMGSHSNESVIFREIGDNGSVSLFDYRNQEPVSAGHWYDVRVEIKGNVWKCYMDGQLKYTYTYDRIRKHYVVAGIDEESDELVVKMVNGCEEPWKSELCIKGGKIHGEGKKIELSSSSFSDENSFEEPEKISARESAIGLSDTGGMVVCAPRSLTVFRFRLR